MSHQLPPASEKYKPTGPIQLSEEKKSASEDKSTVFSTTSEIGEGTITDYMIWSQINILFGAIILGIFAILLSIYTKQLAERDYLRKAKIMSRITLGVNIFITIVFIGAVVFLVAYFTEIK
ncbi:hypothetical protein I4U23_028338 [Adineta vaga]|nr:hypothetical protein I4U23_028338 [Adineta vaga]